MSASLANPSYETSYEHLGPAPPRPATSSGGPLDVEQFHLHPDYYITHGPSGQGGRGLPPILLPLEVKRRRGRGRPPGRLCLCRADADYIKTSVSLSIYLYIYIYIHTYVHIYIYIYVYIHMLFNIIINC